MKRTHAKRFGRGLSLIEMMIALTISVTLMTATLAALDSMFKGYQQTTESASTNIIARIVMARLTGMIRTGSGFGPVPESVLDAGENPIGADYFEFVTARDEKREPTEMVRVEYRVPAALAAAGGAWATNPPLRTWAVADGPPANLWPAVAGELWFVRLDVTEDPPVVLQENPLLSGVRSAVFTMRYDVGPALMRATIDMTIEPDDSADLTVHSNLGSAQTFRLVASAAPRGDAR
ncbi:MAG: prepilin-type N-terminal cleavage/methylation domain-containing protein [Phycisphaerae bacterium]|nr:prepilin-type N-terminal cleavage/methylation domain-containing protein [Phycisphaerae bacterium]